MQPYSRLVVGTSSLGRLFSDTSYADVPGLSVTLAAGGTYRFAGYLTWSGSTTTVGIGPAMGGTATVTLLSVRFGIQTSNTGATSHQVHAGLQPSTQGSPGNAAQTGTTYGITIDGLIVVNAAGTMTVSARGFGATSGTATIATGGRLLLDQVA